jgi:hypothetical protein
MSTEQPKLSGRHQDTLRHVFSHPMSHNVEWRELRALLGEVGVVKETHDGNLEVEAADQRLLLNRPRGKDVGPHDLEAARHFLEALGFRPNA